jgi:hypothetical protein
MNLQLFMVKKTKHFKTNNSLFQICLSQISKEPHISTLHRLSRSSHLIFVCFRVKVGKDNENYELMFENMLIV